MFVQLLLICMTNQVTECNHMIHVDFFATEELCVAAEATDGKALLDEITKGAGHPPIVFDFRCVEMTIPGEMA